MIPKLASPQKHQHSLPVSSSNPLGTEGQHQIFDQNFGTESQIDLENAQNTKPEINTQS